jgi:hypothetical protein
MTTIGPPVAIELVRLVGWVTSELPVRIMGDEADQRQSWATPERRCIRGDSALTREVD